MRGKTLLVCVAAAGLALSGQQSAAQSGSGDWEFTVAPYMLGAAMDGTVGVADRQVALDVPFSDIVENLKFGGMGYFAMKNDSWVLSGQLVYMKLQQSQDVANGTAQVTVKETMAEFVGGFRFSKELTLLAGVRLVDFGNELRFTGSQAETSREASKSWVDPFIGAQLAVPLSDRWWLDLRGDVGGFGVGSNLAWQAWADFGFRASETVSVFAGYHALDMDYEDGSGTRYFRYDVLTGGPQLGVAFRF